MKQWSFDVRSWGPSRALREQGDRPNHPTPFFSILPNLIAL